MTTTIFELTLLSKNELIPPAVLFVKNALELCDIKDLRILNAMELITEEACLNVISHAYEGRSNETYKVILKKDGPKLILAIQDNGLPMDFEKIQRGKQEGIGYKLIKAFADNVNFINLGKNGKRIEYVKDLSLAEIPNTLGEVSPDETASNEEIAPMDTPVFFRLLNSQEGVALARCLYRVYGYTYKDFIYYPEKIKIMIEDGRLVSMVALAPDGEIVAHQGLMKSHRDSKVAEITMGAVDPRYRGRKLFERIKAESFTHIKKQGVIGLFVEAVTLHAYSQKANIATGALETGVLLGHVPSEREYKGFSGKALKSSRLATILLYNRLLPEPSRIVFIPDELTLVAAKIYAYGGFKRTFGNAPGPQPVQALSYIEVNAYNDTLLAFTKIGQIGEDIIPHIHGRLRELINSRMECIFLDLPLSSEATKRLYPEFKKMGFFFCGITPEMDGEDYLRLECLTNVTLDKSDIALASDFAKYLLEEVWSKYEEAERRSEAEAC